MELFSCIHVDGMHQAFFAAFDDHCVHQEVFGYCRHKTVGHFCQRITSRPCIIFWNIRVLGNILSLCYAQRPFGWSPVPCTCTCTTGPSDSLDPGSKLQQEEQEREEGEEEEEEEEIREERILQDREVKTNLPRGWQPPRALRDFESAISFSAIQEFWC